MDFFLVLNALLFLLISDLELIEKFEFWVYCGMWMAPWIIFAGRINVVDLQALLNVDFSEVERKCQEIANKEKHTHLVFGQLVNR